MTTVTFDCYGTLIDWEAGILEAFRELLGDRYEANLTSSDDPPAKRQAALTARSPSFQITRWVPVQRLPEGAPLADQRIR